jgi:hypothetical protein
MFSKSSVVLIVIALTATCFAADGDFWDLNLPEKGSTEYWMVKSQALNELRPFLSRTRREAKGHYEALTEYIKYIGKGQEFLASDMKVAFNPADYAKAIGKSEDFFEKNIELPKKALTWEQLVEFAMEFVLNEGFEPSETKSNEEIKMIKNICKQQEAYVKKIRNDLRKIAQDCMEMKAYLESIDQFDACVKYTHYQEKEEERIRKEKLKEGREELATNERRRRELERKNEWAEKQRRINDGYYRKVHASRVRSRSGHRYYHW